MAELAFSADLEDDGSVAMPPSATEISSPAVTALESDTPESKTTEPETAEPEVAAGEPATIDRSIILVGAKIGAAEQDGTRTRREGVPARRTFEVPMEC